MARNVPLSDLRAWARQLSDTENDPNVTDAELRALANRHICEVYDRLVDAGPADYYASTAQVVTVPGLIEYPLEADFRNLVDVYVRESADERRKLSAMPEGARGSFKAPTGTWTLDVEYIPTPPTLEDDGDTFDGVSGFEELIANMMARDVMAKRESDPSVVMSNIVRLEARIASRSRNRDRGPLRVTDLDEVHASARRRASHAHVACYRLRAGNLELFEPLWGVPS